MDWKQLLIALRRYAERYDNDLYQAVMAGLEERHAVHLGCAIQDIALGLCGYAMPDLDHSFRLLHRESAKRIDLALQFLRQF